MKIVVNDASILIDLLKIDLLDEFFCLPLEMHTTDLVSSEIKDESTKRFQKYIEKKMINIYSFSDKEWAEVVYIKTENPPLSMADCSCFWLCKQLSATLLTSDGKLRSSASKENIPVHGILWLFEELISQKEITAGEAGKKLKKLIEINPRLPHKECQRWLKKWKS
jgi:predicted nucleic acid-binding protein